MKVDNLSFRKLAKLNKWGKSEKNINLKKLTTFKIGGCGKYFLQVNTIENLLDVVGYLEKNNFEYYIIGAGSNILASSKGYGGVLIKLGGDFSQIETFEDTLECGSGVSLGEVISKCRELGLSGMEGAIGIPATIGGAVTMNAGAYDFEMAKIVESVVFLENGKIRFLFKDECLFSYRSSIFQNMKCVILKVRLKLNKSNKETVCEKIKDYAQIRRESQPLNMPSAGSIFKRREDIVVSKCLDECGVKGLSVGDAVVSTKHANFIVNNGDATSEDVIKLINKVKKKFKESYNKELSCEIKLLGEFDETIG